MKSGWSIVWRSQFIMPDIKIIGIDCDHHDIAGTRCWCCECEPFEQNIDNWVRPRWKGSWETVTYWSGRCHESKVHGDSSNHLRLCLRPLSVDTSKQKFRAAVYVNDQPRRTGCNRTCNGYYTAWDGQSRCSSRVGIINYLRMAYHSVNAMEKWINKAAIR